MGNFCETSQEKQKKSFDSDHKLIPLPSGLQLKNYSVFPAKAKKEGEGVEKQVLGFCPFVLELTKL